MEGLISSLVFAIKIVFDAVCGGYFISSAIKHYKREEYFSFGSCVMLAISWATFIVRDTWFR